MLSLATIVLTWSLCIDANIYHKGVLLKTVSESIAEFDDKLARGKWEVSCVVGDNESERVTAKPKKPGFVESKKQ